MKTYTSTVFLILCLLGMIVSNCKKEEGIDLEKPPVNDPDSSSLALSLPNVESLNSVDLSPGFRSSQMRLTEAKSMLYSIYVPDSVAKGNTPLIIALHGGSGNAQSSKSFMECLPLNALKNLDGIIFAPTGGHWWTETHEARVVEFVRLAKLHWPIDSNKVAVTGYSNGGTGSAHFALLDDHTFSAAIPMAANFTSDDCPLIPTYFIHGSEDSFYSPTELENRINGLKQNGCDTQLKLLDGFGHGDACRFGVELTAAGLWLKEVVWE